MTELLRVLEAVEDELSHGDCNDAECLAMANRLRHHHAEIAETLADATGESSVCYEVWQDDMCVAGATDLSDAQHYVAMYRQDGPAELRRIVSYSEALTPEQIDAAIDAHNSAREVGE